MSFPPRATIYNQEIPRNPRSICVPTKRKTEREASIKRINSTRPRDTSSIGGNEREREREKVEVPWSKSYYFKLKRVTVLEGGEGERTKKMGEGD